MTELRKKNYFQFGIDLNKPKKNMGVKTFLYSKPNSKARENDAQPHLILVNKFEP